MCAAIKQFFIKNSFELYLMSVNKYYDFIICWDVNSWVRGTHEIKEN